MSKQWYHIVGVVRRTGLMFWSDDIALCARHSRGLFLQPVTTADIEAGLASRGCPFCKDGELVGQFHRFRSRKRLMDALKRLEEKE
jgi:hypothetical protein